MGENARLFLDRFEGAGRQELRQQHGQAAQWQQEQQQVFHRYAQAGQQGQQDHRIGDQAGGIEEVEGQARCGVQL
ncbi:hypothetical protein D3C84_1201580 [compost metagenome]